MAKSIQTENRYSICIGINDYAPSAGLGALRYAEADASDMDALLGLRGFSDANRKLLLGKDATLDAMNAALGEIIRNRAGENDLVIFYFAGHSKPIRVDDDNESEVFLASYDFDAEKIRKDAFFREETALGMGRLRSRFFERGRSRQRLFIFDSCYSGDFFGSPYRDATNIQEYIEHVFSTKNPGRIALSSCLPIQKALEQAKYGHGLFTYYLLKGLSGEDPTAFRSDGCLTANGLFEYVANKLKEEGSQCPVLSGVQHDIFEIICYPHLARHREDGHGEQETQQERRRAEKDERVHALFADHRGFLRNRLETFVGREAELVEIRLRISQTIRTGGYVTITGQAGQGKSSIIAKLVEEYGEDKVAYHFIPFNPGPDHQVSLLRNLMARLILKYGLTDLYIASESRPALRDYFPKVLAEVVAKGGQEVIFLDGLDQLEEDINGISDLSFLPTNPPSGVVFVLGTRPNDTLKPLELLKPHREYQLPGLSRQDFDRILTRREVSLNWQMADQFYRELQENALYLDLVAKELQEHEMLPLREMIVRLAHDPANLFSLSMRRLKRQALEWREVIKPVLGVLLAAREPLAFSHLRQILQLEADQLRDVLRRLGGLIADTGQQRYTLFHLRFRDYLKQDEQHPEKEYIFANDEEEHWHAVIASWCEQGELALMWRETKVVVEQGRRAYARRHYVAHLYYAHQWQDLFDLLDEGSYGHAKEHFDVSSRSYVQDLDFGRQAASWEGWTLEEGLAFLPHLWRYTLLRGSLRSRADQYPQELFQLMLVLGRETQVLGLAEILTDPSHRVQVLLQIASHLGRMPTKISESVQLFFRAREVATSIENSFYKVKALRELAMALAQAQQWEQAQTVAVSIEEDREQARALRELVTALAQAQQWEQAQVVAASIEESDQKAWALRELATALAQAQQWEQAQVVAASIKGSDEQVRALIGLATASAQAQQWEQAQAFYAQALAVVNSSYYRTWPEQVLIGLATALAQAQQWEQAQVVTASIKGSDEQVRALIGLATASAQAQQWEQAQAFYAQALAVVNSFHRGHEKARRLSELIPILAQVQQWEQIQVLHTQILSAVATEGTIYKAKALSELAIVLAQAEQWEQAQTVVASIEDSEEQAKTLSELILTLIQAQRWEQVQALYAQFLAAANSIESGTKKARALSRLALSLAQAQQWEQVQALYARALEVTAPAEESKEQAETLRALALALTDAQQWEQAQTVAATIKDSYQKAEVLCGLATALARTHQWEQAQTAADSIEDSYRKAEALCELATALAQTQQWEQAQALYAQALAVVNSIDSGTKKEIAMSMLAEKLAQAQQWEQAQAVAVSIEDDREKAEALIGLATALAQAQKWEQAQALYAQALAVVNSIEGSSIFSSSLKGSTLKKLALDLAQTQQWEQAKAVAVSIEDGREKARALIGLATALAQAQKWEQAQALFAQTLAWANSTKGSILGSIVHSSQKAEVLCELATALAEVQQWEQAQTVADSIEDSYQKAEALNRFSTALAQAQQWEQAQAVANSIEYGLKKAWALIELVTALAQARQWEQAKSFYAQALEAVNSIGDSSLKSSALLRLATALAQAQQWEQAQTVAASIEDSGEKAMALSVLSWALVEANEYEFSLYVVQHAWLLAETRSASLKLFRLACDLIPLNPEVGIGLYEGFRWVDDFLIK